MTCIWPTLAYGQGVLIYPFIIGPVLNHPSHPKTSYASSFGSSSPNDTGICVVPEISQFHHHQQPWLASEKPGTNSQVVPWSDWNTNLPVEWLKIIFIDHNTLSCSQRTSKKPRLIQTCPTTMKMEVTNKLWGKHSDYIVRLVSIPSYVEWGGLKLSK